MIVKIMVVGNGVHLHHLMSEIFVLNLKDQKTDFTVTVLHNLAVQGQPETFSDDSG